MNHFIAAHPGAPPVGFSSPRRRSRSRNPSFSSDRPSTATTSGHSLMSPPSTVSPEAAFIAASAASQIVTNDHDSHADTWYDQQGLEPSGEPPAVSPAALRLLNSFLDQLLFHVLHLSRATTLSALRPAVVEVLKPKLAKDAINQADEELREYLGGSDDDESELMGQPAHPGQSFGKPGQSGQSRGGGATPHPHPHPHSRDVELIWKRTRLRCMVYSSLGDMEEEDEDYYMEQDSLAVVAGDDDLISPAVAIFLTSILEFMGEQALIVAGQVAYHRLRHRLEKELCDGTKNPGDVAGALVVEELDMERVALDRTLGRLWRAWKKRIRTPGESTPTPTLTPTPTGPPASYQPRRQSSNITEAVSAAARTPQTPVDPDGTESIVSVRLADERPPSTSTAEVIGETFSAASASAAGGLSPSPSPSPRRPMFDNGPVSASLSASSRDPGQGSTSTSSPSPSPSPSPASPSVSDPEEPKLRVPRAHRAPSRPRSLLIFPRVPTNNDMPHPSPPQPLTPQLGPSSGRPRSMPLVAAADIAVAAPMPMPKSSRSRTRSNRDSTRSMATIRGGGAESDLLGPDADATPKAPLPQKSRQRLSKLITSVAAAGSAIAHATGASGAAPSLPSRASTETVAKEDEIYDFTEEPEILTSERVSLRDRSNSPAGGSGGAESEPSRVPRSMHRSSSVHSARIVEVTPRSPAISRTPSLDPMERMRPASSQMARMPSSPLLDDHRTPILRSPAWPPTQAIAEVEEETAAASPCPCPPLTAARDDLQTPSTLGVPTPKSARVDLVHRVFSAVADQDYDRTPSPSSATKVTILSHAQSHVAVGKKPDTQRRPAKAPRQAKSEKQPPAPSPSRSQPSRTPPQLESKPTQPTQPSALSRSSPRSSQCVGARPADLKKDAISSQQSSSTRHIAVASISPPSDSARIRGVPNRIADDNASMQSIRNFEDLIQSEDTLQYTLTPGGMREADANRPLLSDSPVLSLKSRRSEDGRLHRATSRSLSRSNSAATGSNGDLRKRAGSLGHATGLNSHPVSIEAIPALPEQHTDAPRMMHGSTGPASASAGNSPVAGPLSRRASRSLSGGSRGGGPVAHPSPPRAPSSGGASPVSSRARLQAREAAVDSHEDNSDLIDFIRRGPPDGHHIPRTIAPWRTTMDSDQMAGAVGGKAVDATLPDARYSQATQATTTTDMSMPSSTNSNTALLKKSPPTSDPSCVYGNAPAAPLPHDDDPDIASGLVKRKQRRVRDPYAVDSDSEDEVALAPTTSGHLGNTLEAAAEEEEEEEEDDKDEGRQEGAEQEEEEEEEEEENDELDELYPARRRRPAPKQESLAEFLLNCEPPTSVTAAAPPPTKHRKKGSAGGFISRLTRSNSFAHRDREVPRRPGDERSLSSRSRVGSGFRAGSVGHVPLQVTMPPGYDSYGPVGDGPTTTTTTMGTGRPWTAAPRMLPQSAGRATPRKYEPREAVPSANARMNELAAFLRNCEPPPDIPSAFAGVHQDDASTPTRSFSRMFGRRKKSAAV